MKLFSFTLYLLILLGIVRSTIISKQQTNFINKPLSKAFVDIDYPESKKEAKNLIKSLEHSYRQAENIAFKRPVRRRKLIMTKAHVHVSSAHTVNQQKKQPNTNQRVDSAPAKNQSNQIDKNNINYPTDQFRLGEENTQSDDNSESQDSSEKDFKNEGEKPKLKMIDQGTQVNSSDLNNTLNAKTDKLNIKKPNINERDGLSKSHESDSTDRSVNEKNQNNKQGLKDILNDSTSNPKINLLNNKLSQSHESVDQSDESDSTSKGDAKGKKNQATQTSHDEETPIINNILAKIKSLSDSKGDSRGESENQLNNINNTAEQERAKEIDLNNVNTKKLAFSEENSNVIKKTGKSKVFDDESNIIKHSQVLKEVPMIKSDSRVVNPTNKRNNNESETIKQINTPANELKKQTKSSLSSSNQSQKGSSNESSSTDSNEASVNEQDQTDIQTNKSKIIVKDKLKEGEGLEQTYNDKENIKTPNKAIESVSSDSEEDHPQLLIEPVSLESIMRVSVPVTLLLFLAHVY